MAEEPHRTAERSQPPPAEGSDSGGHGGRDDGHTPRLVGIVWLLLIVNNLGTAGGVESIFPLPRSAFQVFTMGSLVAAFGLALAINPRVRVRSNAFLLFLSLLAILSIASSVQLESGMGSLFRCFRLVLFVATLWLLSVWWRGDLRFVVAHVRGLAAVLSTVALGLVVAPGAAFSGPEGRLVGALWPIPPPPVGMYAAVASGLCLLLWITRNIDRTSALLVIAPACGLLLLTHTRTALVGMVVGLLVAGLSLVGFSGRARRTLAWTVVLGLPLAVLFAGFAQKWLERGQDPELLRNLTGRAKVWGPLLAEDRPPVTEILGVGLTDKSFNGLPIDSGWLTVYHEQGWAGILLVVGMLGVLLGAAALRPPSPARACALFLIAYTIVASYTEVGLGDSSPYLLGLAIAASLLVPRPGRERVSAPVPVARGAT